MKSLAEYIVKSQGQAAIVVALATATLLLSWVGAAALGLYILRFGLPASRFVLLAALIPAIFWANQGDIGPILTHAGVAILSVVLRLRTSWSELLTLLPFLMAALCVLVLLAAPEYVQTFQAMAAAFIEEFKNQLIQNNQSDADAAQLKEMLEALKAPDSHQLMGMLALFQSGTVLLSMLLARWWQAILFNPGGFRQEFHQLRLSRVSVLILVGCFIGLLGNEMYSTWSWAFAFPLVVAGIALVHGMLGIAQAAPRWLILFYAVLLLIRPALGILVALAVMDSALDFRGRLRQRVQ